MSLQEYRRKRRFDRTPEPAAEGRRTRGKRPIFVVQLHHASHRHYDFRLQVGDTLKSWAVPKGPSLDPDVKRLAAEVEDHPVDYADFEGEIPKGQYGGGHVATFDRGLWTTDGDAEAQLAKGHLRFRLFGDRLKGGWHLVRTQAPSRRPQWLLFKERDSYAGKQEADDLLRDALPPAGGGSAPASRPRKARTRPTAVARGNQAWAKRAARLDGARATSQRPGFRAPQLARLQPQVPTGDAWLHEAKWDGYRLIAQIARGKVRLWSRNEIEWTARAPEIVAALEALDLDDAVLDGELVAGAGRQEDFGLLQATLSGEKHAALSYVLFDILQVDGVDLMRSPQYQRKALLAEILKSPPDRLVYSSHIVGRGDEALAMALERGLEGVISKRADAPYQAGRGDAWRKVKQRASDEFAVVGFTAPKGSRSGLGALLLAAPDGARGWRYVGRVGTGFSHELLDTLAAQLTPRARSAPTARVEADDPELRRARWVAPTLVAEVFHHGVGNQGLLRQSSLKALRRDKRPADLRHAASAPTPAGAAMPATRRARAAAAADDVELTHPERVVFPDSGITKRQVFDYYRAMSRWLLPEIQGRPLSIVRCPQGAGRPCFFQKHHTSGMERVDAVPLEEEGGARADYLVVRDEAGLLALAQFNALEFHPWGAQAGSLELADRIVFDLDPGADVPWKRVVDAARLVRRHLRALGLTSYVRTSGGKGLHVVVPLKPACPWPQVKAFARAFAESMAASEPLAYVATATKKFRKGRIFIDYLRNGRGATSVASFSLRAREGAPVAMPLRWEELGRIKGGDAYTLASAPRRMARLGEHPWGDYARRKQDLAAVADRLGKRQGKPVKSS